MEIKFNGKKTKVKGMENKATVVAKEITMNIEITCAKCNDSIEFEIKKNRITEEQAFDIKMPFGQHCGKYMSVLRYEDRPYLYWISQNTTMDSNLVEAAKILLKLS